MKEQKPYLNINPLDIKIDDEGIHISRSQGVFVPGKMFQEILLPYINDQSGIESIQMTHQHRIGNKKINTVWDFISVIELKNTKSLKGEERHKKISELVSRMIAADRITIYTKEGTRNSLPDKTDTVCTKAELAETIIYQYLPNTQEIVDKPADNFDSSVVIWTK